MRGKNIKLMHQKKYLKDLNRSKYLYMLFLPGFVIFVIFKLIPMTGILIAFQDYTFKDGIFGSDWVGLANFKMVFRNKDFYAVLRNTIVISTLKIIIGFPFPIILALIYNEIKEGPFKTITQSITYLPHFFSWVVLGGLIMNLLSPSSGVVNEIISALGGEPIYFLASKKWFVPILIISDIWAQIGWGSIIYLAAICSISPDFYEAAMLDGATKRQKMINITIPCIMPTIITMFILNLGGILNAGFDQIFNLYNPAVYDVADIIDTYVYREGIGNYRYSYSTAISLFKTIVGTVMIVASNYIVKKVSDDAEGIF